MNANANLPQAADANAVQNDPPFPSKKGIILPQNEPVYSTILEAVESLQVHIPPKTFGIQLADFLWNDTKTGPMDGHFSPWAHLCRGRQMKERVLAILDCYAHYDTPYPSPLQILARRINDEMEAGQAKVAQRTFIEQQQQATRTAANDHN